MSHRKKVRSVIYDQMPTIWWKFGENRSSRSWVLFAQKFIFKRKKKKLMQAEHIARLAGMLRGLNKKKHQNVSTPAASRCRAGYQGSVIIIGMFLSDSVTSLIHRWLGWLCARLPSSTVLRGYFWRSLFYLLNSGICMSHLAHTSRQS